MISKTKALSGLVATLLAWPLSALALDPFTCLRDLMPFTTYGTLNVHRRGVEEPFLASDYIVFPETERGRVTGFYVYSKTHAWHYDAVAENSGSRPIRALTVTDRVLDLVAQPDGLRTVSIPYLPGFNPRESDKAGPAVLGASVLPVVGAVLSRPDRARAAYHSPASARESELRAWLGRHAGRAPASEVSLERAIVKMIASAKRTDEELWRPLKAELQLRRDWIQNHNLDESTFKELTRAMRGSCADGRNE